MFVAIAIHHVRPEHLDASIEFMWKTTAAVAGTAGLIEFKSYRDPSRPLLAGISRWRSAEDFQAAMPAIMSVTQFRKEEWTTQPDDLFTLVEIEES